MIVTTVLCEAVAANSSSVFNLSELARTCLQNYTTAIYDQVYRSFDRSSCGKQCHFDSQSVGSSCTSRVSLLPYDIVSTATSVSCAVVAGNGSSVFHSMCAGHARASRTVLLLSTIVSTTVSCAAVAANGNYVSIPAR